VNQLYRHSAILCIIILYCSCSVKRFIPAGEKLYNGAKVKVELAPEIKERESSFGKKLARITTPERNRMFLGGPNRVWWWYVIGTPKKEKGFKAWLRKKLGEAPVFVSDVNLALNTENIEAYLANHGHFNSKASGDTIISGYKGKAVYQATVERPYTIAYMGWRLDSSGLSRAILGLPLEDSVLKKGDQYDADKIKAEANRVTTLLKNKGYYYFKSEDIITYVDTNHNNYTASLYFSIQPQTPPRDKVPFTINKIFAVVADAGLKTFPDSSLHDLTQQHGIYIMDSAKNFKPQLFPRAISLKTGNLYSLPEQNKSLSRLNSYGTFKFIRSEFKRVGNDDNNNLLNAYYYTTAFQKKKLQFELGGFARSNNYMGAEISATWKHRNLFRGAEILSIKATSSLEIAVNDSLQQNNNWRVGGEASLLFPKFLAPGFKRARFAYIPKTRFLVSYDWLRKQELYSQYYLHFRYELNWSDTVTKDYRLVPLSLTFYRTDEATDLFKSLRDTNQTLEYPIPSNFIPSTSFHYRVTNVSTNKRNIYNWYASIETAGTLLGWIKGNDGPFTTKFGNAFLSQFVRAEIDFRYTRKLGNDLFWANRFLIGVGYPYGNSVFLPFPRQFIIGGANSLRGFVPKHLGPGSTTATDVQQSAYPQIGGDYKLEMNSEFRFPFVRRLKGAVFIDAGNIWMKDTLLYGPAGKLSNNFYKEIAIDGGLGIRLDISLLILRADLGTPFYKPWLPEGERWVFQKISLGSREWRNENLVWNVAIGYPF